MTLRKPLSVLIASNNSEIVSTVATICRIRGYRIRTTECNRAAAALEIEPPHVFIADCDAAQFASDADLAVHLARVSPQAKLVLLRNSAEIASIPRQVTDLGTKCVVLEKPVAPDVLLACLTQSAEEAHGPTAGD